MTTEQTGNNFSSIPPPSQTVADPENVREQPRLPFIYYYFYYLYFYILLFIYYYFIYKKSFYDYFSTCLPSRMEVRNTATAEHIVLFFAHLNLG